MPRRLRLVAGILLATALAVAGCTVPTFAPDGSGEATPAAGGSTANAGTADWSDCADVAREEIGAAARGMTYDCATATVPRDWNDKSSGETYGISMIRIRSKTQKNRIGSLLVNPGGPGASGIQIAVGLSFGEALGGLPTEITNRFDILGFDPRGVGRSDPVMCISDADQDASIAAPPDPATQAQFNSYVALNKKIVNGCGQKYGDQLVTFSTEQATKDMDAIRTAVGDDKLTYLGFSYGTLLGATYAQDFPTHVRAMVLDGAIDAKQTYVQDSESQAMGFERAFTNFSTWCQQTPAKCPIAPNARKAVTDAMAAAEKNPVPYEDGRKATSGWIFLAVISSLYSKSAWAALAGAVSALKEGNAKGIFNLADAYAERSPKGTYNNLFDANLAVNCSDNKDVPGVAEIRKLQGEWRAKYPLFGASMAVGMLSCSLWPGERDPYPDGAATGAPPIVVVGTTGDPATPYENTADLATMLGVGHVLTWEGEGHTAYPSTPCIVKAVDTYLIGLQVPQEGLRCPPK